MINKSFNNKLFFDIFPLILRYFKDDLIFLLFSENNKVKMCSK